MTDFTNKRRLKILGKTSSHHISNFAFKMEHSVDISYMMRGMFVIFLGDVGGWHVELVPCLLYGFVYDGCQSMARWYWYVYQSLTINRVSVQEVNCHCPIWPPVQKPQVPASLSASSSIRVCFGFLGEDGDYDGIIGRISGLTLSLPKMIFHMLKSVRCYSNRQKMTHFMDF